MYYSVRKHIRDPSLSHSQARFRYQSKGKGRITQWPAVASLPPPTSLRLFEYKTIPVLSSLTSVFHTFNQSSPERLV